MQNIQAEQLRAALSAWSYNITEHQGFFVWVRMGTAYLEMKMRKV